jgi:hypothetical protein
MKHLPTNREVKDSRICLLVLPKEGVNLSCLDLDFLFGGCCCTSSSESSESLFLLLLFILICLKKRTMISSFGALLKGES